MRAVLAFSLLFAIGCASVHDYVIRDIHPDGKTALLTTKGATFNAVTECDFLSKKCELFNIGKHKNIELIKYVDGGEKIYFQTQDFRYPIPLPVFFVLDMRAQNKVGLISVDRLPIHFATEKLFSKEK